jgi:putative nucleotidyltransferase with HDIG domain
MIARRLNFDGVEDAFMAGIFHDIGIIIEDQYTHNEFVEVMKKVYDEELPLLATEKEVLGFNHMVLGQMVAEKWKLPKVITESIRKHHQPETADGDFRTFISIVYLADFICRFKKIGSSGHAFIEKPNLKIIQELNISKEDIVVWIKDLDEELAKASALMDLQ